MAESLIQKIENRLKQTEAATPGPWFYGYWAGLCHIKHQHGLGSCKYEMVKRVAGGTNMCADKPEGITVFSTTDEYIVMDKSDGEFIASARTNYPAALRALKKAVVELKKYAECASNSPAIEALAEIEKEFEK